MRDPFELEVAVFGAARRLPAEERSAYLDEACAGDAALRQRVEELLQGGEEVEGFLQEPVPGARRPEIASAASIMVLNTPGEKAGDPIGCYKLLQQIGEGGCGVVYMAEQQEPLRRRVALKVIKLGMDTRSVIARFEAERQALALMDHANIAKVFDAGATETGRPFFCDGTGARRQNHRLLQSTQSFHPRAAGPVRSSLPRRPARASKRHRSPRHQAVEHSGHGQRRRGGA